MSNRRKGGRGIYTHFTCGNTVHPEFIPTEHQTTTVKYFLKSPFKGLLLYHELGSGKTCTSIMIADLMLRKRQIGHVYVLTPGSLRKGWINEYCNICGYKPKILTNFYTFITYNYIMNEKLPDFNNSLVIIDEAHNLINGVKNRSKNPSTLYNRLMSCTNCRIIALSGTPIFNYIYEWPILGNLLKPGTFPDIIKKDKIDVSAFVDKEFRIMEDGSLFVKSPTRLRHQLEGIISYFPGSGKEFLPTVIYMEPIKVIMPHDQEVNYWKQDIQESKLSKPPGRKLERTNKELYELLQRLYIMAKKNIITRGASNFYYPGILSTMKDTVRSRGGWVDQEQFAEQRLMRELSMKFAALFVNILLHPKQKHVVFTFFKHKSGVDLIHAMFKMCGIKTAIFSGDLDDSSRSYVLNKFNKKENREGNNLLVLLVTEAGAEGISIREARHMHILESSPRESKIQQAIGRIVRYKSHYDLPKNEQNVKVWRYWSIASPDPISITVDVLDPDGNTEKIQHVITDKKTIDEKLYEKGQLMLNEVNSFLKILQKASVT